jgi:hypothetical protein
MMMMMMKMKTYSDRLVSLNHHYHLLLSLLLYLLQLNLQQQSQIHLLRQLLVHLLLQKRHSLVGKSYYYLLIFPVFLRTSKCAGILVRLQWLHSILMGSQRGLQLSQVVVKVVHRTQQLLRLTPLLGRDLQLRIVLMPW